MELSPGPKFQTTGIMLRVALALVPGTVVTIVLTDYWMIAVIATAIASALIAEIACTQSLRSVLDGSALVTGLLIALCLPPTVPLWIVAIASLIGISLGKHVWGGLGKNLFNPAMVGYAVILVSFPVALTHYDAVTGATALEVVSHRESKTLAELTSHPALGLIGAKDFEWINLAFAIGGCYLVAVKIVPWHLPLAVLMGLGIPTALFYDGGSSSSLGSPLFHWFAGGTMLTAFFIATDPVTSPSRIPQQWVYGLWIGGVTLVIRSLGAWPDGFAFAVLTANLLLPFIERNIPLSSFRPR